MAITITERDRAVFRQIGGRLAPLFIIARALNANPQLMGECPPPLGPELVQCVVQLEEEWEMACSNLANARAFASDCLWPFAWAFKLLRAAAELRGWMGTDNSDMEMEIAHGIDALGNLLDDALRLLNAEAPLSEMCPITALDPQLHVAHPTAHRT